MPTKKLKLKLLFNITFQQLRVLFVSIVWFEFYSAIKSLVLGYMDYVIDQYLQVHVHAYLQNPEMVRIPVISVTVMLLVKNVYVFKVSLH